MEQSNVNIQTQELQQIQTLTPQQVLQVRLLELPVQELEQRIQLELLDNESLEVTLNEDENPTPSEDNNDNIEEGDDTTPELGDTLGDGNDLKGSDSLLDDPEDEYDPGEPRQFSGKESPIEIQFSSDKTFNEFLLEQIGEYEVSEQERFILEYLIGSLDDNGFLPRNLWKITDDLIINYNIDLTDKELNHCISILQQFEPTGIGARNLQECLLLQIDSKEDDILQPLKHRIIQDFYTEFTQRAWDKLATKLTVQDDVLKQALQEIQNLNPRPGISLGEPVKKNYQTISPDFFVTVDDDGTIGLTLNNEYIPQLRISPSFANAQNSYQRVKGKMSKSDREQMGYIQNKIEKAQGFIQAIKNRQITMLNTMKSIIHFQKEFFLTGDEMLIKPLIMKEVAERAKVDISTVSRVCSNKYVETPYGIFPLKHFFGDSYGEGEGVSTRIIRTTLKEIIEKEESSSPYTDEQLAALLKEKGFPIARRTVAKYRDSLGILSAKFRKK